MAVLRIVTCEHVPSDGSVWLEVDLLHSDDRSKDRSYSIKLNTADVQNEENLKKAVEQHVKSNKVRGFPDYTGVAWVIDE